MSYHLLQARSGFTLLDGTRIPGHDLPMMTRTSYDFKWTEISFAGRQFTAIYIPYLVREEREKMLFVSHIFLAPSFLFLPSFGREWGKEIPLLFLWCLRISSLYFNPAFPPFPLFPFWMGRREGGERKGLKTWRKRPFKKVSKDTGRDPTSRKSDGTVSWATPNFAQEDFFLCVLCQLLLQFAFLGCSMCAFSMCRKCGALSFLSPSLPSPPPLGWTAISTGSMKKNRIDDERGEKRAGLVLQKGEKRGTAAVEVQPRSLADGPNVAHGQL